MKKLIVFVMSLIMVGAFQVKTVSANPNATINDFSLDRNVFYLHESEGGYTQLNVKTSATGMYEYAIDLYYNGERMSGMMIKDATSRTVQTPIWTQTTGDGYYQVSLVEYSDDYSQVLSEKVLGKLPFTIKPQKEVVVVSSISVNKTSVTLEPNGTTKVSATPQPSNAEDKSLSWSSSNPSVATVDQSGNVKALKQGTTTITVSANSNVNVKQAITVTVSAPPQPPVEEEKPTEPKPQPPVEEEKPTEPKPQPPVEEEKPTEPKPQPPVEEEKPTEPKPQPPVEEEKPTTEKPSTDKDSSSIPVVEKDTDEKDDDSKKETDEEQTDEEQTDEEQTDEEQTTDDEVEVTTTETNTQENTEENKTSIPLIVTVVGTTTVVGVGGYVGYRRFYSKKGDMNDQQ